MSDFDILAIGAHPDDVEGMSGGTLSLEAARGRRVAIADLTKGERGTRGTPEQRLEEAAKAAEILGVAHRECLGLPDAGLRDVPEHKDHIIELLRRLRPTVVIVHHREQRHPDHAMASLLTTDAAFLAGLVKYRPDLGAPFRPSSVIYALGAYQWDTATPTFLVNVTDQWEAKLRAVSAYRSQFFPAAGAVKSPLDDSLASMELAARWYGRRAGVMYAEAFIGQTPPCLHTVLPGT